MNDETMPIEMEKFTLCVMRTQEGKTFSTINVILTRIKEETVRSVHIIYTMNTLLNSRQFALRLREIEDVYGIGSVVVFSSKKFGHHEHVSTVDALKGKFLDPLDSPRVVIQCSNSTRFEDGVQFVAKVNSVHSSKLRVFMYYDELHKYINAKRREQIEEINSANIVGGILALTATPGPIYTKSGPWSHLRTMNFTTVDAPDYCGVNEHHFITKEEPILDENTSRLVEKVIEDSAESVDNNERELLRYIASTLANAPILVAGARVFVPALNRRVTHSMIRDYLFCINPDTVVIVLNGKEKTMQFTLNNELQPRTRNITCEDEEVCHVIARYLEEEGLESRPLAITGFMCVGMGQTLICEKTGPFTSAIFHHKNLTAVDIYQLFGRTTARSLRWKSYCVTEIYCPDEIRRRCSGMETLARVMALSGERVTTSGDYYAPLYDTDNADAVLGSIRQRGEDLKPRINRNGYSTHLEEFPTLEELNVRLSTLIPSAKPARITKKNFKSGTYVFALGKRSERLNADKIRREVSHGIKYYGEEIKVADSGGIAHRIYVGYDDETPVFFLRWAVKE